MTNIIYSIIRYLSIVFTNNKSLNIDKVMIDFLSCEIKNILVDFYIINLYFLHFHYNHLNYRFVITK